MIRAGSDYHDSLFELITMRTPQHTHRRCDFLAVGFVVDYIYCGRSYEVRRFVVGVWLVFPKTGSDLSRCGNELS